MIPWDGQPIFEGEVPKPLNVTTPPVAALKRVKPDEVVVNRADLEWAICWIALSPPDAKKVPEAHAAYNRLASVVLDESSNT